MATDIQKIIDSITLPAIEIAGPSPHGFAVIKELNLALPSVVVTNLTKNVTIYTSDDKPQTHTVSSTVDFRNMPYKEGSLGILLCSYLPTTDYPTKTTPQRTEAEIEQEYENILAGNSKPERSLNFHIRLLATAYATLAEGGVLILQGVHPKDTAVARIITFVPVLSSSEEKRMDCQIYLKQGGVAD